MIFIQTRLFPVIACVFNEEYMKFIRNRTRSVDVMEVVGWILIGVATGMIIEKIIKL